MGQPTGRCTKCDRPFDDHVLPTYSWGPAAKAGLLPPICQKPKVA
jgi:hypothetical protein